MGMLSGLQQILNKLTTTKQDLQLPSENYVEFKYNPAFDEIEISLANTLPKSGMHKLQANLSPKLWFYFSNTISYAGSLEYFKNYLELPYAYSEILHDSQVNKGTSQYPQHYRSNSSKRSYIHNSHHLNSGDVQDNSYSKDLKSRSSKAEDLAKEEDLKIGDLKLGQIEVHVHQHHVQAGQQLSFSKTINECFEEDEDEKRTYKNKAILPIY